jgi:hypothetical protein
MKTRLVKAIDFAALLIGILGVCGVVVVLGILGIIDVIHEAGRELQEVINRGNDRVIFVIFIFSVVWCGFRWKKMDKRGF